MMLTRFLLLVAGHILGQHLPLFSTELVSSNYQLVDLRLQHFPSENEFGGHGAFSTIALASPTSQTTPPKVPTAFIPYEVNSTEKLGSSLTATWQAVTVDYGGDTVMTFIGETSKFETTAFCLTGDLFRFTSWNFIAEQACFCILSICVIMEICIISTLFLVGLCGMHRRIPRKKRRRLPFYLVKKCRNRRFKSRKELMAEELMVAIQTGADSLRVNIKIIKIIVDGFFYFLLNILPTYPTALCIVTASIVFFSFAYESTLSNPKFNWKMEDSLDIDDWSLGQSKPKSPSNQKSVKVLHLFVLANKTFAFSVSVTDTVEQLKRMVGSQISVDFRSIQLTYGTKLLLDKDSLGEHLPDHATLHLFLRLLGGNDTTKTEMVSAMSFSI